MIKVFTQKIDFSSDATISRDSRTLEDSVNNYIRNPSVVPLNTAQIFFLVGGDNYYSILLNYNVKLQQGA